MSKTGKFLPPAMRVAGTIESARRDARTVSGPMIRNLCDVVESADFEIQKLVRAMRYVATNTRDGWARDWLFRVLAERGHDSNPTGLIQTIMSGEHPTCPECGEEFEQHNEDSRRYDCDCGSSFECRRDFISLPYENRE